jgi:hypothetical protein
VARRRLESRGETTTKRSTHDKIFYFGREKGRPERALNGECGIARPIQSTYRIFSSEIPSERQRKIKKRQKFF